MHFLKISATLELKIFNTSKYQPPNNMYTFM